MSNNNIMDCQTLANNEKKFGDIKTWDILKEFKELYESKLSKIKDECICTSTRIKISMLQDWVRDLTEQNNMLVQVVEELEQEASERVLLLEEKLKQTTKAGYDMMKSLREYDHNIINEADVLERLRSLQSDINNLTEFIRRIRDEGVWSIEGLQFYNVAQEDIYGDSIPCCFRVEPQQLELKESMEQLRAELNISQQRQDQYERETKKREKLIQEQSEQIEKLNNAIIRYSNNAPDKQELLEELQELRLQLRQKTEDFNRLETSVKDMREALTAEVADKHDCVVALRRECQLLEERCHQADKQTHFKDDIIKEMRKELKVYRSKLFLEERKGEEDTGIVKQMRQLQTENESLQKTILNATSELSVLHGLIEKYYMFEDCESKILYDACSTEYKSNLLTIDERDELLLLTDSKESINKSNQNLSVTSESKGNNMELVVKQLSSDDTLFQTMSSISMSAFDKSSIISEQNLTTTLNRLKTGVSKMLIWKSEHSMSELQNQSNDHELNNKLIKNKDEMIILQNDSINQAQEEIKELREKLNQVEKERDIKLLEVQNLQQALKIHQNTINELEKGLRNSEEKINSLQQSANLYIQSISDLENAKNKAENEVEQQRVTIGNLQQALVNTKQQLEGLQGRSTSEHEVFIWLKIKSDTMFSLYEELDEIQNQYTSCYEENVKLSQTADCLRDANLELKTININLQQDIAELNAKIANDKEFIKSLEKNVEKVNRMNGLLEGDVRVIESEMTSLSSELRVLQKLLNLAMTTPSENYKANLTKSVEFLTTRSETLLESFKNAQKSIDKKYTANVNEIHVMKLQELYKSLGERSAELEQMKELLADTINQRNEYENRNELLETRVIEFEKLMADLTSQKTDEMVMCCNSDLTCLKNKVEILNNILNDKSNELLRLHAELSLKSDKISNLSIENENMLKENKKLAHTVKNLEEQIVVFKQCCNEVTEKYEHCKSELLLIKQWEATIRDEYTIEKKFLSDKIEKSKNEEAKLNDTLNGLRYELEQTKLLYKQKDVETQEEVLFLKEEINKTTKQRNHLMSENKKLHEQISQLNKNISQYEKRNVTMSQQLDKCLEELNSLQFSKDKIEEKNISLEAEIDHLQTEFNKLNQEVHYKNESVQTLENELLETKTSRDEICAESRLVVNNVRNWLEEQKRINAVLNNTLREKNLVIDELTVERNLLLKNIKDVCDRYENLSEELHFCKQYLLEFTDNNVKKLRSDIYRKRSGTSTAKSYNSELSENCSGIFKGKHLDSDFDEDTDENPEKWMRKVQLMSEELDKNKKYWQMKLTKSEKIQPVQEESCSQTI